MTASWEVPCVDPAPWFLAQGVSVFPLRQRGKEPACASWDDYRCTPEQAARFGNYGVSLGRLAVLDTDSPDAEQWARTSAPPTCFIVDTARGVHRYYRLSAARPKFIHRDGLTIEFRHAGQYVVGPESIHPSGVTYAARHWSWRWSDIPFFPEEFVFDDRARQMRGSDPGAPFELPQVIEAGERHDLLFRLLRSLKGRGLDRNDARAFLTVVNQGRCHPPLKEDDTFERWFSRGWKMPDRPIDGTRNPGSYDARLLRSLGLRL